MQAATQNSQITANYNYYNTRRILLVYAQCSRYCSEVVPATKSDFKFREMTGVPPIPNLLFGKSPHEASVYTFKNLFHSTAPVWVKAGGALKVILLVPVSASECQ